MGGWFLPQNIGSITSGGHHHQVSGSFAISNEFIYEDCQETKGYWQGFKGGDNRDKNLIFRVKRTVKKLAKTELEVFLVGEVS
ncbi:hypothetical protein Peur_028616 [Populus x canadensis]